MSVSVEEAFKMAIGYGSKSLPHYIFYMLRKGYITMTDDISAIDLNRLSEFEHKEVAKLVESNYLKINPIDIYTLKMDQNNFALIFASNEQQAIQYFQKVFKRDPLNCFSHIMDLEFAEGKGTITFREMRKHYSTFPALVGVYDKASKVLVS